MDYFLRPSRKSPRSLARVTKRGDQEDERKNYVRVVRSPDIGKKFTRVTTRGDEEENNYVRVVRSPGIGKKFTRVTKRGDDVEKEKERTNYSKVTKSLGKKFSRAVGGLSVHSWKSAQTLQMCVCIFFSFVVLICGLWMFFLLDLCKILDK